MRSKDAMLASFAINKIAMFVISSLLSLLLLWHPKLDEKQKTEEPEYLD
jgi:hypothetical protein